MAAEQQAPEAGIVVAFSARVVIKLNCTIIEPRMWSCIA